VSVDSDSDRDAVDLDSDLLDSTTSLACAALDSVACTDVVFVCVQCYVCSI